METSLYISNERIAAVRGAVRGKGIRIKAFASVPVPTGAVINGVVTNEKAFSDSVTSLAASLPGGLKKTRLVFGSSQIYVKRSSLPKLSKKKLMEFVVNEFADVEASEEGELICDFEILKKGEADKGDEALLCAAKKDLICGYAERFAGLKIGLTCIDTNLSAIAKLIRFLPETREDTFVLLSLDGSTVEAMLFVDGSFRFNNRTRLLEARGTSQSTAEISRLISSIIQFNSSERSGRTITKVYVMGACPGENDMMQHIGTAYEIPCLPLGSRAVESPDGGCSLAEYAFAVGDLLEAGR